MRERSCRNSLRRKISEKGMSGSGKGDRKRENRVEEAKKAQQRKIGLAKVEAEKAKVAVDEAKLAQQRDSISECQSGKSENSPAARN